MRIVNVTPKGATVFITDLKLRIGQQDVPVARTEAIVSADLRVALSRGMVRIIATGEECSDPAISELLLFAAFSDAKRKKRLLFAQAESVMRSNRPTDYSCDVPIRPAVFEPVD